MIPLNAIPKQCLPLEAGLVIWGKAGPGWKATIALVGHCELILARLAGLETAVLVSPAPE